MEHAVLLDASDTVLARGVIREDRAGRYFCTVVDGLSGVSGRFERDPEGAAGFQPFKGTLSHNGRSPLPAFLDAGGAIPNAPYLNVYDISIT